MGKHSTSLKKSCKVSLGSYKNWNMSQTYINGISKIVTKCLQQFSNKEFNVQIQFHT